MYKIDLHTHSVLSHDGGITAKEYEQALRNGVLDFVAITDHNEVEFALKLNKKLGEKIIVGEEINTGEGEIIGLYLTKLVKPNLGIVQTLKEIRIQSGLVYIPHPFETFRAGLNSRLIKQYSDSIQILEVFNQRLFKLNKIAVKMSNEHNLAKASGSDSHCRGGLGKSYVKINKKPNKENLMEVIIDGELVMKRAGILELLCPKINKIKKLLNVK